jgi:hypothetical protein
MSKLHKELHKSMSMRTYSILYIYINKVNNMMIKHIVQDSKGEHKLLNKDTHRLNNNLI